ncbi:MAG: hypothetical protein K1X44_02375 [Alphaproteobacteria bacterium]|nr:hypothetical protein [Alphaproteobacteria bacterium]
MILKIDRPNADHAGAPTNPVYINTLKNDQSDDQNGGGKAKELSKTSSKEAAAPNT